jgi:hypothetical protein
VRTSLSKPLLSGSFKPVQGVATRFLLTVTGTASCWWSLSTFLLLFGGVKHIVQYYFNEEVAHN